MIKKKVKQIKTSARKGRNCSAVWRKRKENGKGRQCVES